MTTMTSNKPYLIRAMFDWMVDNEMTPFLLVSADYPDVLVPQEHVIDGRIVLNVSPKACRGLHMDNDKILFTARFSGVPVQIVFPPDAVQAIYTKENGRGMEFGEEYGGNTPPPIAKDKKTQKKPSLRLVE